MMEEQDRRRYETLFYCQKLEDGFLSGDGARALFIRSKLPLPDLTRIWKLSDVTHDNKLDVFEFSLAVYLIESKLCGYELPKQLNPSVYQFDKKNVVAITRMTEKENVRLEKLFERKNTIDRSYLEKEIVQPLMLTSGLSPTTLRNIWNIADLDRDGKLSLIEFKIAFHMIKDCISGVSLNGPVNPFLCFPEEESIIRLCKHKLKIFDKEYLMKRKGQAIDDSFFNTATNDIDDVDFDMLVQCLSPVVLTKVLSGVDENSNNYGLNGKISTVQGEINITQVEALPKTKPKAPARTVEALEFDTVEHKVFVDLESVFESIDKETPDYYHESPTFTPAPITYVEPEPSEEIASPIVRKNPYVGKPLIFEDPVGSETFCDVELEVDFESIINDLDKEKEEEAEQEKAKEEEGRRLPVARVQPIYKQLPVAAVEPMIGKIDKKETYKIDLSLITDHNLKNGSIIVDSSKVFDIDKMGKEKKPVNDVATPHYNFDSKYDKSSVVRTLKSSDHNTEVVDIVQQKRIITENQAKERKKLKEKNLNNETINFSGLPLSGVAGVKSLEKAENNNYNYGYYSQQKNQRNDNEKSATGKQDEPVGYDTLSDKSEDYSPYQLNAKLKTNNNAQKAQKLNKASDVSVDEISAGSNKREEEEKERILLERIKRLEQKRQELLQRKQREAELKNGTCHEIKPKGSDRAVRKDVETERIDVAAESNYVWLQSTGLCNNPVNNVISEEEKRRLHLAAEEKRRKEAELKKRRDQDLLEAEQRRKEQLAKEKEDYEAAKERRQHFLQNLENLKRKVLTEEADKAASNQKPKHGSAMAGVVTEAMDAYMHKDNKTVNPEKQQTKPRVNQRITTPSPNVHPSHNHDMEIHTEEVIRQPHFNSTREQFMHQAGSEEEIIRRNKPTKARPKSYYGGMFNRQLHQIVDDSLLTTNNLEDNTDLVDEEALKQYRREQEFKKEHDRMIHHRKSLDRATSYTVDNVEKIWEIDAGIEPQKHKKAANDSEKQKKQEKPSANPNRRSLVNTLTTEWNSFIDVLEDDKKRESGTVEMRKQISDQRRSSQNQSKMVAVDHQSKEITSKSAASEQVVENDSEVLAKQSGNVKNLVHAFKRLSVPCFEDVAWKTTPVQTDEQNQNFPKGQRQRTFVSTERSSSEHSVLKRQDPLRDSDINGLDMKREEQKSIIRGNAPKRKSRLANTWSSVVSQ